MINSEATITLPINEYNELIVNDTIVKKYLLKRNEIIVHYEGFTSHKVLVKDKDITEGFMEIIMQMHIDYKDKCEELSKTNGELWDLKRKK